MTWFRDEATSKKTGMSMFISSLFKFDCHPTEISFELCFLICLLLKRDPIWLIQICASREVAVRAILCVVKRRGDTERRRREPF